MAEDKKTCFIIMPITTPELLWDVYRDGAQHFEHVLKCLIIPSVEQAGFGARPPTAQGADLIQAKIIKNLETADLVLCDMSALNANVFFEFGMRTALNKPVCVVKDDETKKVPFDTGIVNYHQYASSLETWEIESEISKLAGHIKESAKLSKGENDLWRFFGIKSEAKAYEGATGADAKLDHMIVQIESLSKRIEAGGESHDSLGASAGTLSQYLRENVPDTCRIERIVELVANKVMMTHTGELSERQGEHLQGAVRFLFDRTLSIRRLGALGAGPS